MLKPKRGSKPHPLPCCSDSGPRTAAFQPTGGSGGKPLKTLLEHVELDNYNTELINWKLDEPAYREYVLSGPD